MKFDIKAALFVLLVAATFALTACGSSATPYETNNEENFTVSVRFDANGGCFTTNTAVIVDSYNTESLKVNGEGLKEIAIISPDNELRGTSKYFNATNNGNFLVGWYATRTESTDGSGNTVYSYSDKWDFENDVLKIDPNKQYLSQEPCLTLYAVWAPFYEIEFYSVDTNELIEKFSFDPNEYKEIKVPEWNKDSGEIEMYEFPEISGYTFNNAYYDAEKASPVSGTVNYNGVIDYTNGTTKDTVTKIYIESIEGEWYHIYNEKQFLDHVGLNNSYELHADLDFEDKIWPTVFVHGNYAGKINGNGHTVKNVSVAQTNNAKINSGLFGNITEGASIQDLTFENVQFTIKAGTRIEDTCYGLLAGTIAEKAELNGVKILDSKLYIDSDCYFNANNYFIGLVCGSGDPLKVETAEIECLPTGEDPSRLTIHVSENTVTVEFGE